MILNNVLYLICDFYYSPIIMPICYVCVILTKVPAVINAHAMAKYSLSNARSPRKQIVKTIPRWWYNLAINIYMLQNVDQNPL